MTHSEAAARIANDQVLITGRVTSGRGLASWQLTHDAEAAALLGRAMCPGSLNLILDAPQRFREDSAVQSEDGRFLFWPASLNGLDVWIYRWPEAPLHIAELVSDQKLRTHLNLEDGDTVRISVGKEDIAQTSPLDLMVWSFYWRGRRRDWFYTHDGYASRVMSRARRLGGAQIRVENRSIRDVVAETVKVLIGEAPIVGRLAKAVRRRWFSARNTPYGFHRLASADGKPFEQVINLLNYTKTSNSSYAAQEFPAAYHTIRLGDREVRGQRNPDLRFEQIPIDFRGKTVLDIGCNQGGMLFARRDALKWGVGVDFDARMINAANRIRAVTDASSLGFYVFDLEKEPIDLIRDFLPDQKVDICFLLSVCMWIENWREVIDFAQRVSREMVFETNGSPQQQADQLAYLRTRYSTVSILSRTSDDDPHQKNRTLIHLLDPINEADAKLTKPHAPIFAKADRGLADVGLPRRQAQGRKPILLGGPALQD